MSVYLQGILIAAGVVLATAKPVQRAICATVNQIASCAFALQSRCSKRPSLQERFSLKTLPDFEQNENEWKRETGLTLSECRQIDQYVQDHRAEWKKSWLFQRPRIRIPKNESGLPRTLIIYHEDEHLCVQVCCKTKGNLRLVGEGSYKRVKRSIEWLSKSLWAQSTAYSVWEFCRYHKQLDGMEGIAPYPRGLIHYVSSKDSTGTRSTYFSPLRTGTWYCFFQQFWNDPIYRNNLPSFANQMFKILLSLEKKNVVHDDLSDTNILYYSEGENLKFEAMDFDYARYTHEKQKKDGNYVGKDRDLLRQSLYSIKHYYELDRRFERFIENISKKKISESFREFTDHWLPKILKASGSKI
jgi:hypothetical protein